LVIANHSNAFLDELSNKIAATPCATMLTASIADAYRSGVDKFAKLVKRRAHVEGGAALFTTDAKTFLDREELMEEIFGPSTLVVECESSERMLDVARALEGQLTATIHASDSDDYAGLLKILETKVGRIVFNGFPTGVEVLPSMVHGGPYPATSDGRSTSVGTHAIERFTRYVAWQSAPEAALPDELKESNPLRIARLIDGRLTP
jgi:NADP-dependent aldehyde dehydrogenase